MTERQSQLLKDLVERYAGNPEPVASAQLAEHIGVSSATVRNDFAALEQEGLLMQPYTSAGRIPTLKGYIYYLEHFYRPQQPQQKQKEALDAVLKNNEDIRSVARELAEMTALAVLITRGEMDYYYTGISKLFSQPEFSSQHDIIHISSIIEAFDTVQEKLYDSVGNEVKVMIGEYNPLAPDVALLSVRPRMSDFEPLISILGPLRMNYNRNAGLLQYIKLLLETK